MADEVLPTTLTREPPTPRPRAPTGQPVAGRTPDPANLAGDPSPADPDPLPESSCARCQRPQGPRRGYRRFQERLCQLEDPLQGLLGSARAPSPPAMRLITCRSSGDTDGEASGPLVPVHGWEGGGRGCLPLCHRSHLLRHPCSSGSALGRPHVAVPSPHGSSPMPLLSGALCVPCSLDTPAASLET